MRSLVYGLAALAAIGIAIGIAALPSDSLVDPASAKTSVLTEPGTLVMNVPDMMCEFSCFPKVKETLESSGAVQDVELAAQKEEGTIDTRQVVVKYDSGFDVDEAIRLLKAEGFDKSEVVQ